MSLGRYIATLKAGDSDTKTVKGVVFSENMKRKKITKESVLEELVNMKDAFADDEWIDTYHFFIEFYHSMVNYRPRASGVFHPSSLTSDCERRLWYDVTGQEKTDPVYESHGGQVQAIFDLGTFIHLYIQRMLMRAGALEVAEMPIKSRKWRISGHADGILKAGWFGLKEKAVLEIKTINLNGAKSLVYGPLESHKNQAGLYANILGYKYVYFVYYIKDTSEIKEFLWEVETDRLEIQYGRMKKILKSVDGDDLEKVCPRISCPSAKKCAWRSVCFSSSL